MNPARTPTTNLELVGGQGVGDLPAQVVQVYDPDRDEGPEDSHEAVLTTWKADDGERRALANGAAVEVLVHCPRDRFFPISVNVTEPPEDAHLVAMLRKDHVDRAFGMAVMDLAKRLEADDFPAEPEEILELWHRALEETREGQPLNLDAELQGIRSRLRRRAEVAACTCEPKPNGEPPDEPDADCPMHGFGGAGR